MLAKRVIVCLDVRDNQVVKGVEFRNHQIVGSIEELAERYSKQGADELVLYDITASIEKRSASAHWVKRVAQKISIPFCVAGGIRNLAQAETILNNGADKVSINSPALENPELINELAKEFGSQAVVVGIDSKEENGDHYVYQYTGSESTQSLTYRKTFDWIKEAVSRGAGEIVLNCMNQDGRRKGFDCDQIKKAIDFCSAPLIASGGAGSAQHFVDVFQQTPVSGALAASLFHIHKVPVSDVKNEMVKAGLPTRVRI